MTRFYRTCGLPLLCAVVLTAGCQNMLTVRVQRALVPSETRLKHNSRLGIQLDAAIADLTKLINSCEALDQGLEAFVQGFPPGPYRDAAENVISLMREDLRTVTRRGTEEGVPTARMLREECQDYFGEPDITTRTLEIWETLKTVNRYLENHSSRLRNWLVQAKKTNVLSNLAEQFSNQFAPNNATDSAKEEVAAAMHGYDLLDLAQFEFRISATALLTRFPSSVKAGFGGFMSTDVYSINPSDPKYAKILKTHGPWHSLAKSLVWQDVSAEFLTKASAGVTGDSAIMFVMEHPGQVRMFQVSLDPAQITSNIGMLISKASAAGAKYMSGGLAP